MTAQMKRGFTLIELLIVMAILGVLAVVVLVAINPVQQLARTRDTGRKSSITQIGHAMQAYYTARNAVYPAASATWVSSLSTSGELSTIPGLIAYGAGVNACTSNVQSGWCYAVGAGSSTGANVWARLESQIENSKCGALSTWFVFSTDMGRGGIVCNNTEPTSGAVTFTD